MKERELLFILPGATGREVLMLCTERGWDLPMYDRTVPENVEFGDLGPIDTWFRERYGIEVFVRHAVDREGARIAVFVLCGAPSPIPFSARPASCTSSGVPCPKAAGSVCATSISKRGLPGRTKQSAVGYRSWYDVSCTYTSAFFGLATIEELRLASDRLSQRRQPC